MDEGGAAEPNSRRHRASKRKRSKRNKAQTAGHDSKVVPPIATTNTAPREKADACASPDNLSIAGSSMPRDKPDGGASSRPSVRSKAKSASKPRSSSSLPAQRSLEPASAKAAVPTSKQSLDATR
ncbi:hypothetical protein MTO96_026134 [Rhipicephalus appendiculatus]